MTRALPLLLLFLLALPVSAAEKDTKLYELRIYWAAEGKLDALHARFRDHTLKLFEKHGMTNVGYWVPVENPDSRLIYIVAHKDRAAGDASWKAFREDPAWKKVIAETEKNGKLAAKVVRVFQSATDFSPAIDPKDGKAERVFEMRTYLAVPEKLTALQSRFRDHTVKLFEKHGITNVGYWTLADFDMTTNENLLEFLTPKGQGKSDAKANDPAKSVALVYLISHPSADARKKSFESFGKDAAWTKALEESHKNGSLTVKDGVKSLMLKATDYSPMK